MRYTSALDPKFQCSCGLQQQHTHEKPTVSLPQFSLGELDALPHERWGPVVCLSARWVSLRQRNMEREEGQVVSSSKSQFFPTCPNLSLPLSRLKSVEIHTNLELCMCVSASPVQTQQQAIKKAKLKSNFKSSYTSPYIIYLVIRFIRRKSTL